MDEERPGTASESGKRWRAINYGSAQWINNGTGGPDYQSGIPTRTYQWRYRAPRCEQISSLKIVLPNLSCPNGQGEVPGANPIGVKAAIVHADQLIPMRFGGVASTTIPPGELAESDELEHFIPADAHYGIRVCVSVGAGEAWPVGPVFAGPLEQGSADGDLTTGGSIVPADGCGYCPAAVLVKTARKTIGGIGDSIMHGWGDAFSVDADGNVGWFSRLILNRCGQLKMPASGSRADQFSLDGRIMDLLDCSDVIIEGFGRNDISAGYSASKVLSDRMAIWRAIRARYPDKKLLAATVVPITMDNTAPAEPLADVRNELNDSLSHVGDIIDGVIDFCPAIETAPGSNVFRQGMSGEGGDWTHLAPKGYAAAAEYLDLQAILR
ncbi:MAG TPA: SGNH/GDSL hydrolase family protein [Pararhizobium sp.]|nr:SGNH/GDSL hydrolase family protein [Pararhizobium sp.]